MALTLVRTTSVSISTDNPQTKLLAQDSVVETDSASLTFQETVFIPALASGSGEKTIALPVGMTTGKFVYVKSTQTITVRFDVGASGDKRIINKQGSYAIFEATCDFAALFVTNASGNPADIEIILGGV